MFRSTLKVLGLLSTLFASNALLAADASPDMLAGGCMACHGPNGASAGPAIPTISGLTKDYLKFTLADFKSGSRQSTIMGRMAKGYTESEIEVLSAYFSAQPFVMVENAFSPEKAAKGKELHALYCEQCHTGNGRDITLKGPVLAGQVKAYLVMTLDDFQNKRRFTVPKMKDKLKAVNRDHGPEGLTQIVEFYASQRRK
ncbi:c-type cytochrome [Magnetovibrio sp. PR-2]|uniref:c-type cytochrome n=1 Tax=Magnetovibrio sp. PR-2 TaxID=3120356 RepID=UPI002FCE4E46